ncbi:MAG: transporter related protein [Frankiales bacterium]|nr:transporter related protein [Frankiales bacterium]MCW2709785.1 transporter related protein [Frankiales bacterium]
MPDDAMIRLDSVSKTYADGTAAVADLSLDVGRGEICVLVGPSGCGKTTTMKMINRLIDPTSGSVLVDGQDVAATNPTELRRRIGYVIQNVGLFPHQRVRDNVMTVPRLLGWDRKRARSRADELLELVGLDPVVHGNRYPAQLSGGQRQRVGVARALAADPVVLLMDEPFSAVDPVARERLQIEFLRVHAEVGTTVVLVTHDIDEAVRLGTRVAILREGGHLEQYAPPAELLTAPATDFVAGFVGSDRMVKALSVMPLATDDLEPGTAEAAVSSDVDLGRALVALLAGGGRVEVRDGDRSLGVLTADGLVRQAVRRSLIR